MGLPADILESWVSNKKFKFEIPIIHKSEKALKNPEIPILEDYSNIPHEDFWLKFPFNPLPTKNKPNTPLLVDEFENEILFLHDKLSIPQRISALQCINDIRYGADSLVDKSMITNLDDSNSSNMGNQKIGSFYTDQLVTLLKKKFISGPFIESPIESLRVNSLFAIEQGDKYRPILNLSAPEGNSFNEAVSDERMGKTVMSSPVQVAKKLYAIGQGAILSKIDHQSAYKLIPTNYEDLWLQGFRWLGRLFIETSQIFGARSSVPNYDRFHNCFSGIIKIKSGTPDCFLERQLDDQIVMTSTLEENKKFVETYINLANTINLPLAPYDKPDKAFLYQQKGTILGISFDTTDLTWTLPSDKNIKYSSFISELLVNRKVMTNDIQKLLGMINTVIQLCPPLKFFKSVIIDDLRRCLQVEPEPIFLSSDSVMFLHRWLFILNDLKMGFPIPDFSTSPPAKALVFVSDAAGCSDPTIQDHKIGVGAVGHLYNHEEFRDIFYIGQCLWPSDFITKFHDVNEKSFGNKSTLLETIGLIVAIVHNYSIIQNKHVVCKVDNVAVVWAYQNGKSRTDPYTSLMISVLNHIACSTPFKLYVEHLPRVSTLPALLADTLSRTDNKGRSLVDNVTLPICSDWSPALSDWFSNPVLDWSLPSKILNDCGQRL